MRVTSVDLYSNDTRRVKFDVVGPDVGNPYLLKGIAGTDAEEIVPMFYGQGTESREKYYDMKMPPRELTIRIGLNPNYGLAQRAGDLRDNLLRMISAKRGGLIQVRLNDNAVPIAAISGFITKFIGPVTNKEPEAQITIRCDDPFFKSLTPTNQIVANIADSPFTVIDPVSTAHHGFKMKLTYTDNVTDFVMSPPGGSPDWVFQINYAFLTGDELYISSVPGDKYVYRVRSAATLHLADLIEPGSIWPIMFPEEDNDFTISGHGEDVTINEWYWYETFWGI
jgi:hypothetical protein